MTFTRHPKRTPVLRPLNGEGQEHSYWAGLVLELVRKDKLCYVVAVLTLAIVTLHAYGIDVLPFSHAARAEISIMQHDAASPDPVFTPSSVPATFPPPP